MGKNLVQKPSLGIKTIFAGFNIDPKQLLRAIIKLMKKHKAVNQFKKSLRRENGHPCVKGIKK
jgi:hypothetical protein